MRWYADDPSRRARQVLADLAALTVAVLGVRLALLLRERVLALGDAGRRMAEAGSDLSGGAAGASSRVDDLPVLGDRLTAPFERVADAGTAVTGAGRSAQHAVAALGSATSAVVVLVTLTLLTLVWAVPRLRWARAATVTARFAALGPDLLALRVLATAPEGDLVRLARATGSTDLVGDWRRGDERTVAALAALHAARLGLRV